MFNRRGNFEGGNGDQQNGLDNVDLHFETIPDEEVDVLNGGIVPEDSGDDLIPYEPPSGLGESFEGGDESAESGSMERTELEEALGDTRSVVIVGGTPEEVSGVAYRIVQERTRQNKERGEEDVLVLSADLNDESTLIEFAKQDGCRTVDTRITDANGVLLELTPKQISEVLGETVAAGEIGDLVKRSNIYFIEKAVTVLNKELGRPPTLAEIRDGLAAASGARAPYGEIPTLGHNIDIVNAVRGAYTEKERTGPATPLDNLRACLQSLAPLEPEEDKQPRPADFMTQGDGNGVTAINVRAGGYNLSEKNERTLLGYSLLPLVSTQMDWGKPDAVVINGAEYMSPDAVESLEKQCRKQGITLVTAYGETYDKQFEKSKPKGRFAILGVEPIDGEILSKLVGTEYGSTVSSTSQNMGTSADTTGWSLSFDDKPESGKKPSSGSASGSSGPNYSSGISDSTTWGDKPIIPPSAFSEIRPGEVVISEPGKKTSGIFNISTGEKIAEFPPENKPAQVPIDVENEVVEARDFHEDKEPVYLSPADVPELIMDKPDGKLPKQRFASLSERYLSQTGRSAVKAIRPLEIIGSDTGKKPDFLRFTWDVWHEDVQAGKTRQPYSIWAKNRSLSDREIRIAKRKVQEKAERDGEVLPSYFDL